MAYADEEMSTTRMVSIGAVALLHIGFGYALVTGLARDALQEISKDLTTFDVSGRKGRRARRAAAASGEAGHSAAAQGDDTAAGEHHADRQTTNTQPVFITPTAPPAPPPPPPARAAAARAAQGRDQGGAARWIHQQRRLSALCAAQRGIGRIGCSLYRRHRRPGDAMHRIGGERYARRRNLQAHHQAVPLQAGAGCQRAADR